jgi:hypothetical protein
MPDDAARSLVRVKLWSALALVGICLLIFGISALPNNFRYAAFAIAWLTVVFSTLIRCKKCRTSVVMEDDPGPMRYPKLNVIWPPKKCPSCGVERV